MVIKTTLSFCLLISCIALLLSRGAHAEVPDPITQISASELEWTTSEEGAAFAPLLGERFNGAYRAMVTLPAGVASPPHVKSANMYGVVVSGTFVHTPFPNGTAEEVRLGPGSFYKIPANLAHISKCVSTSDCVTYLHQDGKFDFLPVAP